MQPARLNWICRQIRPPRRTLHHAAAATPFHAFNAKISATDAAQSPAAVAGALAGRRIAVKDNIVTTDLPTTAASKALTGHDSPFEATVVKLLRHHGAMIASKTNLDEFGMGSNSLASHFGPVWSPFSRGDHVLSAGGSSGGSAVAVATDTCWAALGTDTGGSVRLPAAYTGVVGFKPSYGLLSRWGVIQYANSLDTVGILAKTVATTMGVYECLSAFDSHDPASLPISVRERLGSVRDPISRSLRIGIPVQYNIDEVSTTTRRTYIRALESLQTAGHTLHSVSLPSTRQALSAYYVLAPAEASSNLAKYDGIRYGRRSTGSDASAKSGLPLYAQTRSEGFGEEVKRRILLGAYTLSSEAIDNYFVQAQKVRRLVQHDFDRVFTRENVLSDKPGADQGVDVLLTPTAPTLPPTIAEVRGQSAIEGYMNDVFTVPASLAGLPAISVPVRLSESEREGMEETDVKSVGLQIIGQFGDDELVLCAAKLVEHLYK